MKKTLETCSRLVVIFSSVESSMPIVFILAGASGLGS
jgi:hypothetical protein